ncbi:hypothetical protein KQI89_08645 [Clostridium sp. MSJ-4]|uniref:Uncharacterized protein n=1 Tax=Clostridium simiarum TaxID=2841506 RepID=A0ABS6F2K8_9CLOT|nr:hypothetical protein [Clostridium simiarum]MBU5591833.1 hypothetical protein [Clostridium simiarum]
MGLQNIEIGLNKVLRDKSTINELELLKKYVNLISKYNNANLDINSKVYENISVYISGSGYNKSRCGIGDTTMIFDFLTNKIYSCPQEVNTEIGYFTNDTIKIDDVKKYEMCSVSNKNNAICSQCEYTKFCSFGCYLEKNNMHANCKDETEKVIKYIFENFETLFLSEEK